MKTTFFAFVVAFALVGCQKTSVDGHSLEESVRNMHIVKIESNNQYTKYTLAETDSVIIGPGPITDLAQATLKEVDIRVVKADGHMGFTFRSPSHDIIAYWDNNHGVYLLPVKL